ncbi:ROK family transcriptional regulator [Thauera mechernichensis]
MDTNQDGRGAGTMGLRRPNDRRLFQLLHRLGEASKAELARRTQLTSTAVGTIIQVLEQEGLVTPTGRRIEGQRGQPATLVSINSKGAFGIGVRLDRDAIETILVNLGGDIIGRRVHDCLLPAPADALALVVKDITALLSPLGAEERARVAGVGVAQPYNLGAWLGELGLDNPSFAEWDRFDFGAALEHAADLPVYAENDGNAAAIAELFYGCGRKYDDFLYVFMGPAIGAGIALGGTCVRGVSGNAGDIAVMPVPASRLPSAPAPTGKWTMLLARASLNALVRHLRWHGEQLDTHVDLGPFIRDGHPAVDEWLQDCVDALAPAVRSAHAMLDVPVVVLDADVDFGLIERLREALARELRDTAPEARGVPDIVRGTFGSDAGAIGAASLPMFFNFSPRSEVLNSGNRVNEEAQHA